MIDMSDVETSQRHIAALAEERRDHIVVSKHELRRRSATSRRGCIKDLNAVSISGASTLVQVRPLTRSFEPRCS